MLRYVCEIIEFKLRHTKTLQITSGDMYRVSAGHTLMLEIMCPGLHRAFEHRGSNPVIYYRDASSSKASAMRRWALQREIMLEPLVYEKHGLSLYDYSKFSTYHILAQLPIVRSDIRQLPEEVDQNGWRKRLSCKRARGDFGLPDEPISEFLFATCIWHGKSPGHR